MTGGEAQEVKATAETMATDVRRDNFKNFWDKFSDKPDTNSMMLNHSADDLEASDRADILSSLPQLANKDVVDIGAGIGRFTTVLAQTARWVLSTDFIESFISKNQERNAHLGNINYQVGDAVNLAMPDTSVDLVFTNWLMMYLSDAETVEFIFNCMRWLRPHGVVHLRESCSEPSTGRAKAKSMHSGDTNPTHYRFSSLYINLLRNIRYRDEDNKLWRFNVHWSCSVPTYVKRQNNWRQVHWLAEKVAAEEGAKETTFNDLLELFGKTWKAEQQAWDKKLDEEKYCWTDKIFSTVLNEKKIPANSTVYVFTPREVSPFVHVNSHLLAEKFSCNVWNVETVAEYYRTSLTKANNFKDQRVRFGWNASLRSSVAYWQQRGASFDTVIATELLANSSAEDDLTTILKTDANVYLLEAVETIDREDVQKKLTARGLKLVSLEDVTENAIFAQETYFKDHDLVEEVIRKHWEVTFSCHLVILKRRPGRGITITSSETSPLFKTVSNQTKEEAAGQTLPLEHRHNGSRRFSTFTQVIPRQLVTVSSFFGATVAFSALRFDALGVPLCVRL
ncbi:unnamed protein product [Caenorhabditis auriculariae]|uniref:phosphoethanolamine N-methyltransferase n=1 Tax=Caenorhabditis auriculariae TaxID=2777116 RepID=A0A8S1H8K3_9PELO|nr:unnamed protein product [Caenorhabditis auriculariae]